MGFPRQEYWNGLLFPSPGDLPDPGNEPTSPALTGGFFTTEPPGDSCSVTQLCPTFCKPMDYSMPGFPVHHQFLELSQTHINRISDAIQQSHSLSSLSLPAFNLSHLGSFPVSQLFPSGGQSIGVSASTLVLPMNTQD